MHAATPHLCEIVAPRIPAATPQAQKYEVELTQGRAIVWAFNRDQAARIARQAGYAVRSVTLIA